MTREEAIKIFNTVWLFGKCDLPKKEIEECLKLVIGALEQKPCEECGKYANKWIPASDEHPNKNGSYLVQVVYTCDEKNILEYINVDHANDDGTWLHENAHRKIVAWMPLPEPYNAESEG